MTTRDKKIDALVAEFQKVLKSSRVETETNRSVARPTEAELTELRNDTINKLIETGQYDFDHIEAGVTKKEYNQIRFVSDLLVMTYGIDRIDAIDIPNRKLILNDLATSLANQFLLEQTTACKYIAKSCYRQRLPEARLTLALIRHISYDE